MEIILLAVTVVSLLVALIMGAAAWRASREARARMAARVAALAAAASSPALDAQVTRPNEVAPAASVFSPPPVISPPEPAVEELPVAIEPRATRAAARISTFAAPRPAAASAARVPDLALNGDGQELPLRVAAVSSERPTSSPIADSFLGGDSRRPSEGRQRGLAVAAAVLFVALGGGAYWTLSGGGATGAAGAPSESAPLELMSLRHERTGSRLVLSGLVRNPVAGAPIEALTAVVFLFDAEGAFITSARAGVDFNRLAPGDESPFVISVDAPSKVARYRVSFRTDDGVLAHVDRRSDQPVTTAIAGGKS
jgi:hypothetical protein